MDKSKWGVHAAHCCVLHGCKYGNEKCPVVHQQVEQKYICGECRDQGFEKVEHLKEYQEIQALLKQAKEDGNQEITVPVDFLDRMLNPKRNYFW